MSSLERLCSRRAESRISFTFRFHFFSPNDFTKRPVAALDEHVGQHSGDKRARRSIVKDGDDIHGGQGGEDFRPLVFILNRPSGAFELARASVAVDSHHEDIAQFLRFRQVPRVAGVEQVEAAVGEDDPSAGGLQFTDRSRRLFDRQNFFRSHAHVFPRTRDQKLILARGLNVGSRLGPEAFFGANLQVDVGRDILRPKRNQGGSHRWRTRGSPVTPGVL